MATPDKSALTSSYKGTMADMRQELTALERAWSTVIHAPLSTVLGVIGRVLFRPRALLIGGIFAVFSLIGLYLTSRLYGITLNGTEPLMAFGLGWVVGVLYDLFFIATRRQSR